MTDPSLSGRGGDPSSGAQNADPWNGASSDPPLDVGGLDEPDQPNAMTTRTRDENGRYVRDPETVGRDAEATRLRGRGWDYQRIADHFGIAKSSAYEAVKRCLDGTTTEAANEMRQLEVERLDILTAEVWAVLEKKHVVVSHGRVVTHNGEPLIDDAPVLQAVDRLLKIAERRSKLLGLDAPAKAEIGGTLTYELVGVPIEML